MRCVPRADRGLARLRARADGSASRSFRATPSSNAAASDPNPWASQRSISKRVALRGDRPRLGGEAEPEPRLARGRRDPLVRGPVRVGDQVCGAPAAELSSSRPSLIAAASSASPSCGRRSWPRVWKPISKPSAASAAARSGPGLLRPLARQLGDPERKRDALSARHPLDRVAELGRCPRRRARVRRHQRGDLGDRSAGLEGPVHRFPPRRAPRVRGRTGRRWRGARARAAAARLARRARGCRRRS